MIHTVRSVMRAFLLLVLALLVGSGGETRAAEAADGWVPLFDGRTLDGWRAAENPASFRVADGAIECDGPRAHLFYDGTAGTKFSSFEFETEVRTRPGANSGVFFHTAFQDRDWPAQGYEVQVNNTATGAGGYRENKKTGSLYGVRNVHRQVAPDNEWFRLRIVVRGPAIQIYVNDLKTVDYVEPKAGGPGTFALQCHDPGSRVSYRGLRVRVLPEPSPAPEPTPAIGAALAALHDENYPVIDLHTHLKGGLTLAEVVNRHYRTGINAGIAINCGLGFPTTNDTALDRALQDLRHPLVFAAIQAEGREWVKLVSPAAIARFDYVFTDAMTLTDDQGRRMRLWIADEVKVDDAQAFMEMLVARTVGILEQEPVDIFANPTFLPAAIVADYDRLWTPERRARVIAAAVKHGVAIEINDRFGIPSAAFLKQAKQAGARFTFGTNNGGRGDLGNLDHSVRMVGECGLQWSDFWLPGLQPSRAQRALAAGR
jgi:hypothetical protein